MAEQCAGFTADKTRCRSRIGLKETVGRHDNNRKYCHAHWLQWWFDSDWFNRCRVEQQGEADG